MKRLLLAALAVSSSAVAEPIKQATPPQQQQGRFVIVFGPFARADMYLLDTQTGRTWRDVQFTELQGSPEVWQPMSQMNTTADLLALEAAHPPVKNAGPAKPQQ